MKMREIIFNDLGFNECYPEYDPKQHLRDFSRRSLMPCVMLMPMVL